MPLLPGIAKLLSIADTAYVPPSILKSMLMHTPAVMQSAASAAIYQAVP
jgi:hypothetical protein